MNSVDWAQPKLKYSNFHMKGIIYAFLISAFTNLIFKIIGISAKFDKVPGIPFNEKDFIFPILVISVFIALHFLLRYCNCPFMNYALPIASTICCFPINLEINLYNVPQEIGMYSLLIYTQVSQEANHSIESNAWLIIVLQGGGTIYLGIKLFVYIQKFHAHHLTSTIYYFILYVEIITMKMITSYFTRRNLKEKSTAFFNLMTNFKYLLNNIGVGIAIISNKSVVFINDSLLTILDSSMSAYDAICNFNIKLGEEKKINYKDRIYLITLKAIDQSQLFTLTDITLVNQLLVKEEQARLNQKLLYAFSHEFRTPLGWLDGALSLIQVTPDSKQLLKTAKHSIKLILFYVNELVSFSKITTKTEQKKFSVLSVVNESIDFVRKDITLNQNLITSYVSNEIPRKIIGDPMKYLQILTNIIILSNKSTQKGKIRVGVDINKGMLYTIIEDTGIPLSEHEIECIVSGENKEACLQTRYGLGMLQCMALCNQMEGGIFISSNSNGNIYTFWIKFTPVNSIKLHENHLHAKAFNQRFPIKVLIVDDTMLSANILSLMLQKLSIPCDICTDGMMAFNYVIEHSESISLILMDVNMPIMDGIEATRKILTYLNEKKMKPIPIIMCSAIDSAEVVDRALKEGAIEFFVKPITLSNLRQIMIKLNLRLPLQGKSQSLEFQAMK
jgi:signal transduction histidine kinase/CheY-like chemotaxis protein